MSPISSSRFLIGKKRSLGCAANHLLSPRTAVDGAANSTPCTPHAPPSLGRRAAAAGHACERHWYRGRIVRGRRVFSVTLLCACAGAPRERLRRRASGRRTNRPAPSPCRSSSPASPPDQAVARPATPNSSCATAARAPPPTSPSRSTPSPTLDLSPTRLPPAADLGDRTRPRRVPEPGPERSRSARPGAARRRTSTPGPSDRSPPGSERTFIWQVVPVNPGHAPCTSPSPPVSPARPKPRSRSGGAAVGESQHRHRPPHRPRHTWDPLHRPRRPRRLPRPPDPSRGRPPAIAGVCFPAHGEPRQCAPAAPLARCRNIASGDFANG